MNNLLIIDGHNFLFKSFAVPFKFSSQNGTPLHVVTTFLSLVRRSVGVGKSSHIVVVFDAQSENDNYKLSKDYKSNRRKNYSDLPDSPFKHLDNIKVVLDYLNIKYLELGNCEGDDVIASICCRFTDYFDKIFIASNDTDFFQLLNQQINIIKLKPRNTYEILTPEYVQRSLGINVSDYIFYKALIGDKSDNIKGIDSIGPVTARKIINKEIGKDLSSYSKFIELNTALIKLKDNIDLGLNKKDIELDERFFALKNQEVFDGCSL